MVIKVAPVERQRRPGPHAPTRRQRATLPQVQRTGVDREGVRILNIEIEISDPDAPTLHKRSRILESRHRSTKIVNLRRTLHIEGRARLCFPHRAKAEVIRAGTGPIHLATLHDPTIPQGMLPTRGNVGHGTGCQDQFARALNLSTGPFKAPVNGQIASAIQDPRGKQPHLPIGIHGSGAVQREHATGQSERGLTGGGTHV